MFVFTVLFSKYFEVHAKLYGTRKFMFCKVGRDLKSLGTTALDNRCVEESQQPKQLLLTAMVLMGLLPA